jgi:hypothetical protein
MSLRLMRPAYAAIFWRSPPLVYPRAQKSLKLLEVHLVRNALKALDSRVDLAPLDTHQMGRIHVEPSSQFTECDSVRFAKLSKGRSIVGAVDRVLHSLAAQIIAGRATLLE